MLSRDMFPPIFPSFAFIFEEIPSPFHFKTIQHSAAGREKEEEAERDRQRGSSFTKKDFLWFFAVFAQNRERGEPEEEKRSNPLPPTPFPTTITTKKKGKLKAEKSSKSFSLHHSFPRKELASAMGFSSSSCFFVLFFCRVNLSALSPPRARHRKGSSL